jgi:hypothetical protein
MSGRRRPTAACLSCANPTSTAFMAADPDVGATINEVAERRLLENRP